MRKALLGTAVAVLMASAVGARADHDADLHSANMVKVGSFDNKGTYTEGTDIAFWGDLAVLGNYQAPGGFRLVDISDPTKPVHLGALECPGPQNDVSIWNDLVFLSVDSARNDDSCKSAAASQQQFLQDTAWEGLRIVSIADPAKPAVLANVKTDCGSHTHTLVPDLANGRMLVYIQSYPLTAHNATCNPISHRKISVVEVPLANPKGAKVIGTPSVSPAIGCHDVSILVPEKLAAAACITETQLWDISDPASPAVLSRIVNPLINIHHSTAFSFDGKTIVIGDELGGAAVSPGCLDGEALPLGGLWFYDVSNPAAPVQKGSFSLPRREMSILCTAHNFNVVPQTDRNVLVSAWYDGGTTVVDFTDPADPKEIAFYTPKEGSAGTAWSSYWYNGYVYVNNFLDGRGFDVYRINDAAVAGAARWDRMNPQLQEALPVTQRSTVKGARETKELPATGTAAGWTGILGVLGAATLAIWVRRARLHRQAL